MSLKTWIKKHAVLYDTLWFLRYKEPKVEWVLRRLVNDPQKHLDYLVRHSTIDGFGSTYPRTFQADLKNPTLFHEKLLWLKYYRYNQDELVTRCYDKYLVRDFLKEQGCESALNDLYGAWANMEDIPWDSLPDEYVMKVTNGCGAHVFKRSGEPFSVEEAKRLFLRSIKHTKERFTATGDLFATYNPQTFICERLMVPNAGDNTINDYKFYCFHGEPKYLLYIWDRANGKYADAFKKIEEDGTLTDRSDFRLHSENVELDIPACFPEMLEIARKLSAPFPFVRVDLYNDHGKAVFGELTFTPAGSYVLSHVYKKDMTVNVEGLQELGNLLHLENEK